MSAHETDLFPEELLEEAFAADRPDPRAFAECVAARLAERERGETGAAHDVARPTWIRRAAAILPPGVIDLALLGKLGGTAKGLPGLAWLAAPWALLLMGAASLAGAMALTARLDASLGRDLDDAELRRRLRRGPIPVLVLLLMLTPLVAMAWAFLSGGWQAFLALFLVGAAALLATVVSLSRAGVATRPTVVSLVVMALGQLLCLAVVVPGLAPELGPLTRVGLPSLLMGTQAAVLLHTRQRCPEYRWLGVGFLTLAALLYPLIQLVAGEAPFGATRAELAAWVERCEGEERGLGVWEEFGHAVDVLGTEGLDLSVPRAALAALDTPPALAALRSGLVPAAELGHAVRSERLIANEFAGGEYAFRTPRERFLELSVLRARGELGPERAAIARASLDAWVPEVGDWGALEDAWYLIECADLLGDDGFVDRHSARLEALLVHHWDGEGREYAPPGGFASWLEGEDGRPERHPHAEISLHGVRLMGRVGVPAAVDTALLDRFLGEELESYHPAHPHPYDIQAAVARLALREYAPRGGRPWAERIGDEALFLSALALCVLSLWVVRRAPDADTAPAI